MKYLNIQSDLSKEIIQQIQQDLVTLGFLLVKEIDGIFGKNTYFAIREFQIYASMPYIAQENVGPGNYLERLSQIKNTKIYSGPISGEINKLTQEIMSYWLKNRYRCPLVVYTKTHDNKIININVWLYDEPISTKLTVYVKDLTAYYTTNQKLTVEFILGQLVCNKAANFLGPVSLPKHCNEHSQMTVENWLNKPLYALSPAEFSTYNVIQATAKAECYSYFDCINGYDNAFISFGPCHWTLALAFPMSEGELCGYFAYLAYAYPNDFQKILNNFGVNIDKSWISADGTNVGKDLFNASQRKYTAWLSLQGEEGYSLLPKSYAALNYFRNWHWFYRFRMGILTSYNCKLAMWDMTCLRIKNILLTPHQAASAHYKKLIRLGDLYTSECCIAILLRWHVRYPADIVSHGNAGRKLQNFSRGNHLADPPQSWGDNEEQILLEELWQQIKARRNSILLRDIMNIMQNPHLKKQRGSFLFNL